MINSNNININLIHMATAAEKVSFYINIRMIARLIQPKKECLWLL